MVSRLFVFLDALLDEDFTAVIAALIPHSDQLMINCTTILSSYANVHKEFPFPILTVLLLMGTIVSDPRAVINSGPSIQYMRTTIDILREPLSHSAIPLEGLKRVLRSSDYRQQFLDNNGAAVLTELFAGAVKLPHHDTLYHKSDLFRRFSNVNLEGFNEFIQSPIARPFIVAAIRAVPSVSALNVI
jgi:hypothetical protein